MSQGDQIIWVGDDLEHATPYLEQLKALSFNATFYSHAADISSDSTCHILIFHYNQNLLDAIDDCLKLKLQFASTKCMSIFITSHIELVDKEHYFRSGGDHLIIEPYGLDELLSFINAYNVAKTISKNVQSQLDEASSMALVAMENASDYGLIINFVKNAINAYDYQELATHMFSCTSMFSSSCLLGIKSFRKFEYFYSGEHLDSDLRKILEVNKTGERVVKIGDIIQINHNNLVCLVEGLPVDDNEKMGRILDGLVMLCDIADRFAYSLASEEHIHHSDHSRRFFLTTLSHELKTPLNSILGFSNVLLAKKSDKPLGDSGLDALNRIIENTTVINTIISTLLEISSNDSNLQLHDHIEIERLTLRLNNKFSNKVKEKKLQFTIEQEPNLALEHNEKVITNMLEHLLDNAIKFTDQGSIVLSVNRKEHPVLGPCVVFEVTDTGIGIDPADHSRIFEEIGQLNQDHDRAHYGIGLGLYYVKQMCDQVDADIQVSSALGEGAKFTLSIPMTHLAEPSSEDKDLDDVFF